MLAIVIMPLAMLPGIIAAKAGAACLLAACGPMAACLLFSWSILR